MTAVIQGAAKGGRQKEFDHFCFVFGTLSVTFGHLFWCFCHFFCHFFAKLLLPDSFAAGWVMPGSFGVAPHLLRNSEREREHEFERERAWICCFPISWVLGYFGIGYVLSCLMVSSLSCSPFEPFLLFVSEIPAIQICWSLAAWGSTDCSLFLSLYPSLGKFSFPRSPV